MAQYRSRRPAVHRRWTLSGALGIAAPLILIVIFLSRAARRRLRQKVDVVASAWLDEKKKWE